MPGLFRVPGNTETIRELKTRFDSGDHVEFDEKVMKVNGGVYALCTVCCCMKCVRVAACGKPGYHDSILLSDPDTCTIFFFSIS